MREEKRLVTKEDLDELEASFNEHFAKIERDLALLKFGYGPSSSCALLIKIAFF